MIGKTTRIFKYILSISYPIFLNNKRWPERLFTREILLHDSNSSDLHDLREQAKPLQILLAAIIWQPLQHSNNNESALGSGRLLSIN